jgi:glycosyltransferase involved in cell wall biosynthesis
MVMRIAFIGQKGIPAKNGGVERHVEILASNLVTLGQEVFVYARRGYNDGKNEYHGAKLIFLPSIPGKNFDAISHTFLACLDVIKRKVDIIHFQSIGPASLIWLIKIFKPKTPIVFTFHCQDYHHQKWGRLACWYLRFGEMVGCRLADKIIVVSKELKDYVEKKYGRKSIYIPNGAPLVEKISADSIRRWGLETGNYLVSVSRLVRHKGIHHLIAAYQSLNSNKKLVIVGEGAFTDDYVDELHKLAGDNPNIIFTGNQSGKTLAELYSNAYAFIQPSENEGLSIALLEAMSYGLPCLASDIEANKEVLEDTGYLFANKNVDDLKNKLQIILNNPEKADSLGQKALERVIKEYNWDDITDRVIGVYNNIKENLDNYPVHGDIKNVMNRF